MALAKAKEIVSSAPVVVFSETNCRHLKWVTNLLTQLEANFRVIELDLECDGSDVQSALTEWTAQRTLPIVFIGGNHIRSCESAKNFFTRMLQALEDASIVNVGQNLDIIKKFEQSLPPDTAQLRSQLSIGKNQSMSSEPVIDYEDQEASDDDDDRNHKHRRREAHSSSFDDDEDDVQELSTRRANGKRRKPLDNRNFFHDNSNNGNMENSSKLEKRRPIFTPGMQGPGPSELGSRARINQTFRTDAGPYFDRFASTGRPSGGRGRGRGRSTVPWSHQDSRFNPLDTLDFASQVVSQGLPTHPSLFVGAGIPNSANPQNASWGAYGFVPGLSNSILDPLQPLGLQGTLQPTITPLFNMGMPHQRCRDFDEQGFCLRGDMCPMEHGVNRIVVEDVQSLSQFNLSVSDPNSHAPGIQAGQKSVPAVSASSGLFNSSKFMLSKDGKPILADDTVRMSGIASASGNTEADVYDPDQPLWNNEIPEASGTGLMLSSSNNDEPLWNIDSSQQSHEQASRVFSEKSNSLNSNSSVWGRIGHGSRSKIDMKINNNLTSTSNLLDENKEDNNASPTIPEKKFTADLGKKETAMQSHLRLGTDSSRNSGRMPQKASRTLYVHGIPKKNNTRDALLAHFEKFGGVVDIYIPLNSEKAFVQYSKREEAEAALKAPDAVMGNRFIKLWWANRDRVSNVQKSNVQAKLLPSSCMRASSIPSCSSGEKEKEVLSPAAPTRSKKPIHEMSVAVSGPKIPSANTPKIASPVQKKLDGLELLKEELRKKQEILAQKRDEFRRQLDKFEKQAVPVKKGEVASEQVAKRLKVDVCNKATKAGMPSASIAREGAQKEVEDTLEMRKSEVLVSSTSEAKSTTLQNSILEQTSHLPVPQLDTSTSDNWPTSFRILPPLPANFADVAVLQDHFSLFGDLTSVVLEDPEKRSENEGMKSREDCSACVTFTSCGSAERAFVSGKYWQGHSLCFLWLSDPSSADKTFNNQERLGSPMSSNADVHVDLVPSVASSPTEENSADGVISDITDVADGKPCGCVEDACCHLSDVPKAPSKVSHSNSTKSSCEDFHLPDVPDVQR
ncbi:hypothetical protein Cni_G20392 [Canna indica]|uniref:Zinc finger CCCH domain-containing protein 27 n=1 Tax=Canna indica TaxID=4628 RepID=A0AAQ3KMK2_9LILI|nr:hypothetical protein Cni_G20392 [Canna indica]